MHRYTVDLVDEPAPLTPAAGSGREHDDLVPTTGQTGGQVMDLNLDPTQSGQIAVR